MHGEEVDGRGALGASTALNQAVVFPLAQIRTVGSTAFIAWENAATSRPYWTRPGSAPV